MTITGRSVTRALRGGAALALLVAAAGCATRAMPTPLPYRAGGPLAAETALLDRDDVRAAAPDGVDPADRPARFPVLYATNRRPKGPADAPTGYTARRGLTTWLGAAFVRFGGDADTAGDVVAGLARNGRPRLRVEDLESYGVSWRTIPLSDRRAFEVWDEDGPPDELRAPEARFLEELGRRLGEGGNVLVYVPGFNTPFEAPVRFAAEFAVYLGENTAAVAFSWPARSNPLGYSKQMTNAQLSVRSLRELLMMIGEHPSVGSIDILSYSAGAPIVSGALHELRLMHRALDRDALRETLRIRQVIYAGADEDLDRFRDLYLDGFGDVAERITIYSSARDIGLRLSEIGVRGSRRLGRGAGDLSEGERRLLERVDSTTSFVDVSRAQRKAGAGDLYAHGYWFGNAWVSSDVLAQLRFGLGPAERGLVREEPGDGIWRFPDDYPERVDAAFRTALSGE